MGFPNKRCPRDRILMQVTLLCDRPPKHNLTVVLTVCMAKVASRRAG